MKIVSYLLFAIFILNGALAKADPNEKRLVRVFGQYVEYRPDNIYIINGERIFANVPRQIQEVREIASIKPASLPITSSIKIDDDNDDEDEDNKESISEDDAED